MITFEEYLVWEVTSSIFILLCLFLCFIERHSRSLQYTLIRNSNFCTLCALHTICALRAQRATCWNWKSFTTRCLLVKQKPLVQYLYCIKSLLGARVAILTGVRHCMSPTFTDPSAVNHDLISQLQSKKHLRWFYFKIEPDPTQKNWIFVRPYIQIKFFVQLWGGKSEGIYFQLCWHLYNIWIRKWLPTELKLIWSNY